MTTRSKSLISTVLLCVGIFRCSACEDRLFPIINDQLNKLYVPEEIDPDIPAGCTPGHDWETYDCGDFGIGLCSRRVDRLYCNLSAIDNGQIQNYINLHPDVEVMLR